MTLPIDLSLLPPAIQKILDGSAPAPLRQMAARGIGPGLRPSDALAAVMLLAESADEALSKIALATLEKLPLPLLNGALAAELPAPIIDRLAARYADDALIVEKLLAQSQIAPSTLIELARGAHESVAELLATNEERLLRTPAIIEALYLNKQTRMSTADRLVELAVRNGVELQGIAAFKEIAAAIEGELIAAPSPEPTPDDVAFKETEWVAEALPLNPDEEDTHDLDEESGEEKLKDKFLPLSAKLANMTISQKIRRAMLGTPGERMILVRDTNRLVASAAVRSPMIQENEIIRISAARNVSDDVLRTIANSKEWLRVHQVKVNLVSNPRTPFVFAAKLLGHMREHELKQLAKSKNVSGQVAAAAKQQLLRKGKKT